MKYPHLFIPIIALTSIIFSPETYACSCREGTIKERIAESDVIFTGTVKQFTGESAGKCGSKTATVTVSRQWKGTLPETIEMPMNDGCVGCGMYLNTGTTYLIYGHLTDQGTVGTGMCSGSRPVKQAAGEFKTLETYAATLSEMDKAIETSPDSVTPLMAKTDYLLKMHDDKGAYVIARKASGLETGKRNAAVWKALGQSLEGMAQHSEAWGKTTESLTRRKQAMEAYRTALKLSPNDISVRRKLQFMQLKAGEPMSTIFPDKNASSMDFSGRKLEKITFAGFNLQGADFSHATLRDVVFDHSNLESARFEGAQLSNVSFKHKTNLAHLKVKDAQFYKVLFDDVDMADMFSVSEIRFEKSIFKNLILDKLKTNRLIFHDAAWKNVTVRNSDFSMMSFTGTMKNVTFLHSDLFYMRAMSSTLDTVTFDHTNLKQTGFSASNMKGAIFNHVNATEADFHQTRLDQARFEDTDLTQASFYAAGLQGAVFRNVIAPPVMSPTGADYSEHPESEQPYYAEYANSSGNSNPGQTNFYMSVYDCATLWPPSFSPEKAGAVLTDGQCTKDTKILDMHGASAISNYPPDPNIPPIPGHELAFQKGIFKDANLRHMILRGVNFDGADFSSADLSGTELSYSSIRGANFTGATLNGVNLTMSRYDCTTVWPHGFDHAAAGAVSVEAKCADGSDLRYMDMNGKSLRSLALAHANMEGVEFGTFAKLQSVDLSGADMTWTKFDNATFTDAVLTGTDFSNARLSGVRFERTRLADAILINTLLDNADLTGMDLRGSDHQKRKMREAILVNGQAEGVNFAGAALMKTDFSGARLNRANFAGADLTEAKLQNPRYSYVSSNAGALEKHNNYAWAMQDISYLPHIAHVAGADFSKANLTAAYLGDVDFSTDRLESATLTLARFSCGAKWPEGFSPVDHGAVLEEPCEGVNLPPTDLSGQDLSGKTLAFYDLHDANLKNADLSHADLKGTDLSAAHLDGADLLFATYDCSTRFPKGYDPGKQGAFPEGELCKDNPYSLPDLSHRDLRNQKLNNRYLVGMNLIGADLRNASLNGSDLTRANLSGTKLQGTDFYGVTLLDADLKGATYDCSTKWNRGFSAETSGATNKDGSCPAIPENRFNVNDFISAAWSHIAHKKQDFSRKDIVGTGFRDMNLSGMNFSNSKADWTIFTQIDGADFRHASLRGAIIEAGAHNTNFEGADLSHADIRGEMSGANFRGAILKNAHFSDYSRIDTVDLTGARYDCRTFWGGDGKDFDPRTKGAILEDQNCSKRFYSHSD